MSQNTTKYGMRIVSLGLVLAAGPFAASAQHASHAQEAEIRLARVEAEIELARELLQALLLGPLPEMLEKEQQLVQLQAEWEA